MAKTLSKLPFLFLLIVLGLCFLFPSVPVLHNNSSTVSSTDTAWMLTATALVFIMTPGLAFFYGGMVNKKNVISTMLQSFICLAIITVIWFVFGFSLVFGKSTGGI